MLYQVEVDHGPDVAAVVDVETGQLADDDVDDVEHLDVEVVEPVIQNIEIVTSRALRQERQTVRNYVEIDFVAQVQVAAFAGEREQLGLDFSSNSAGLKNVTVLVPRR